MEVAAYTASGQRLHNNAAGARRFKVEVDEKLLVVERRDVDGRRLWVKTSDKVQTASPGAVDMHLSSLINFNFYHQLGESVLSAALTDNQSQARAAKQPVSVTSPVDLVGISSAPVILLSLIHI